uniref:RNase H domain-containing protein n=1 Tax=Macrostomum lignano TaxID=282301 RepID=A0A1I8JA23_9PLAT
SAGIAQPPPLNSPASPAASLAGSRTGQHRRQQQQQRSQRQQHLDESTVTSTCALADLDDLDSLDGAGGAPADDPDQLSQALLRMSTDPVDCSRLRQGQPFGLVLPLLYGPETRDPCPESRCPSPHASLPPRPVRDRAAQILANLAACPEAGAKEKLILCHLDQVRAYCDAVRAVLCRCGQLASLSSPPPAEVAVDALRDRCCSALSVLLELSYSDTDRPAIAELGGVECLSDLLLVDFCRTQYRPPPCSLFLRRYAASALTNLSYGDAACKRRVCLRAPAVWSLVEQLKSPPGLAVGVAQPVEEELCQVTAAVIRNLSWQADAECRAVLGRLGAAGVLTRAALQVRRETTLRSLLSALWNLSAHSTANKEAICAVPGSLSLLCACLTCNPSLAETGGGVLRNISSVVAVREDLRSAVRPAFPVLLTQLRSASLTVVANACGILWNLSSNHLADQRLLTRLGAVPMLRCLIQSKHKPLSASVHYNSSGQSELTLPQCVRLAGSVAGGQDGTDGCAGASASVTAAAAVAESTAATPAASASASAPGGSVQPTPLVFSRGSSGHSLDSVGLDSLRSWFNNSSNNSSDKESRENSDSRARWHSANETLSNLIKEKRSAFWREHVSKLQEGDDGKSTWRLIKTLHAVKEDCVPNEIVVNEGREARTDKEKAAVFINLYASNSKVQLGKEERALRAEVAKKLRTYNEGAEFSTPFTREELKDALDQMAADKKGGVDGIEWFASFLEDRKGRVRVGDETSKFRRFQEGLPQGAVSSPALFLLYANGWNGLTEQGVEYGGFADDLAIWASGTVYSEVRDTIQRALIKIERSPKDKSAVTGLTIAGRTIATVRKLKYLGITIDGGLTFAAHTEAVLNKMKRRVRAIRVLANTSWGWRTEELLLIYKSIVESCIWYCAPAWLPWLSSTSFEKLERAQRECLRLAAGLVRSTPIEAVYVETNIEPIRYQARKRAMLAWEKATRAPEGDPLRECSERTGNRRLQANKGWRDQAREECLRRSTHPREGFTRKRHPPWRRLHMDGVVIATELIRGGKKGDSNLATETIDTINAWGKFDLSIYTDGSVGEGQRKGGAACVVYFDTERRVKKAAAGEWCSSLVAEERALELALDTIAEAKPRNAIILTDCKSALLKLSSEKATQDTTSYRLISRLREISQVTRVVLQWVPGHVGVAGNEDVDQEAKEAAALPQDDVPVMWNCVKAAIRKEPAPPPSDERLRRVYKHKINKCAENRSTETTLAQLRCGQCKKTAYWRQKIGAEAKASCQDCGEEEDKDHWVWCDRWHKERARFGIQGLEDLGDEAKQQQQPQTRTVQRSTQPQQIPGAAGRHRRPGSASKASSAASSSSKDEDDGLDSQILQDCIRSGMPPSRAHAAAKTITTVTDDRPTVFHVEHTPSPPSSVDLNYGAADGAPAQQQQQQQQQQSAPALSLGLARGVEERDDDDDEVDEVAAALAIEDEEDEEEAIDIGLGIEDEEDELDEHEVAGNVIHEEDDEEDIGPVQSGVGAAVAGRSTRGAVGVQCDEKTVTYKTEDTPAHFSYRTSAQTSSRSSSCSSDNADQLLEACISSAMPKKQQQQLAAARARPAIDSNGEGGDSSASSNSKASFFWIGFDGRKQRPQQQQQPLAESASSEAGPSKPKTQASLTGAARHQHRLPPPAPPRQPAPGSSSSSSKIHLVHQHHRLACRLHAGTDRRLYTLTEERSSPSPVELRDADRQSSSGGSRTSADAPGRPVDSRTFSIHSDEEPAAGQLTLELSDIDTSDLSGSSMEIDAAAIRESPHASATNAELTAEVDASQDTDTDLDLTDDEDDGDATGALFGQVKPPAAPSPVPIASVRHVPAVSQLPAPKPIVAGTSWVPVSPSAIASGTASSRLPMPASTVRPQAGASSKPSTIPTPVMASTPAKPSSSASSIAAPSSKLTPPSSSVLRQQQQQQPMLSGAGKPLGIVAPTPVRSAPPAPSSTSISAGRRSKDSGYSDASPAGSLDGSPAQRFTLQVTSSASSTSASASIHRQQSPITFNLTISSGGGGGDSEAGSTICDEDDVSADIEDVSSSRLDSPPAPSASSAAGVGRARIVKRPKSVDGAPGPPRKLIGGGGGRGGSAGRGRVSSISGSP